MCDRYCRNAKKKKQYKDFNVQTEILDFTLYRQYSLRAEKDFCCNCSEDHVNMFVSKPHLNPKHVCQSA